MTAYRDKPYASIKPGQSKDRDYFSDVNQEKPSGEAILSNFTRYQSIYKQNVSSKPQPGGYKVPLKNANTMSKPTLAIKRTVSYELAHNPALISHTAFRTQYPEAANSTYRPVSANYWKTTYQAEVEKAT